MTNFWTNFWMTNRLVARGLRAVELNANGRHLLKGHRQNHAEHHLARTVQYHNGYCVSGELGKMWVGNARFREYWYL